MDAEGGGGGRMKRPVVVEDFLREPRKRGSSSGRCQDRCPARAGNLRGKAFAKPCGGRGPNLPAPIIYKHGRLQSWTARKRRRTPPPPKRPSRRSSDTQQE